MSNSIAHENLTGPTAARTASRRALLSKWLRGDAPDCGRISPRAIPRRNGSGPVPLSLEQQRLWFFHQLEPHSPLYTMPIALRLSGRLHRDALQNALDAVVARHDALRTVFVGEPPVQEIRPPTAVAMQFHDLRTLPQAQRDTEARRLLETEALRPFDLSRKLMIRTALVQMDEEEWLFLVLMHHIASDDWSWRIFCRELAAAYKALTTNQSIDLPEVPLQYADFTVWQQEWLRGDVLHQELDHWKRELSDAPPVLELPTDHPRPANQSFRGACEWLKLPSDLCGGIGDSTRDAEATLFMTLLAAFEILIHRYTGFDDIVIGSPVAGRTRGGLEKVVGLFVNMLALRTDLGGNPTFPELLRRVRTTVLQGLAHQDMPFEKLVEELQPERSPSHAPLIQVMFALQDELAENLQLDGLTAAPVELDTRTAKFDLTLTIIKSGAKLNCCAEFNTDLFERETIRRMLGHYQNLLQAIVANPERRLLELPLLSDDERTRVLADWNRTAADFPRDLCVHELFQRQARETPEAVALVFESQQFTYGELDRRANQVAHRLRRIGIGPEKLVGVCMERSSELVITLMGILKAGGAYLPLDSTHPAERLRFLLEDSKASLVVTRQSQLKQLESLSPPGLRVVSLENVDSTVEAESNGAPCCEANPDNLAYVIYTSGSTGRPKGVQIPHRAVVNLLSAMRRQPGLNSGDTLLSVTSISFDIAALEIFLPLSVGARLVLATAESISNEKRLSDLMRESGATVMQATPSLWRFLVDAGWTGNQRLKILCGGESLSRELANDLLARSSEVWNLYGPTETTIWSAACKIEAGSGRVSVGRPIANTQIYLLDRALQPVPIGASGEVYIGGEGLTRGYLNRPELTAERFISNPFAHSDKSNRLYRTGDIGRQHQDGTLEILGRADFEIKLRGHRIDPGEIESVLRQHPSVRDAVVVLRDDEPGGKRLAAYMVCSSGLQPDSDSLRRFLKGKLPDYMIPSAFVTLEEFPLTPNGKIDRRALPPPASARTDLAQSAMPRNPVEARLAEIWREVLKLKSVGVEDNFFQIGGHSLLAMQVMSRVRKCFGVELSLRSLFEAPTIAGMAAILGSRQNEPAADSIPKRQNLSDRRAKDLLDRLDELTGEELDSLLEEVPAGKENDYDSFDQI